jgi:hypothetical protein
MVPVCLILFSTIFQTAYFNNFGVIQLLFDAESGKGAIDFRFGFSIPINVRFQYDLSIVSTNFMTLKLG